MGREGEGKMDSIVVSIQRRKRVATTMGWSGSEKGKRGMTTMAKSNGMTKTLNAVGLRPSEHRVTAGSQDSP
jgi:hypothetical protein